MNKQKKWIALLLISLIILTLTGCSSYNFSDTGTEIISAKEALKLLDKVVLVDAQSEKDYLGGHIAGSVNIERADIVISDPVANMLAPASTVKQVLENAGISNDTAIVIYDKNNNMDAARLWWTMKVYGHENVKVVSGGINALVSEGAQLTKEVSKNSKGKYDIKEKNENMIATLKEVKAQLNDPQSNVKFLDTRTEEEYNAGTIPTSILIDYIKNNYTDGTYRSIEDTRIMYIEAGLVPDDTIIMYCKTSIRGAQTYLALYNAGYRNLKLYDGAWVEYESYDSLPIQMPDNTQEVKPNQQDNS